MDLEQITNIIVVSAIQIHRDLGPGLFESVYELSLAAVLRRRGLRVECQRPIAFSYEGVDFEQGFRIDLLVNECVIVEIKSIERLAPVRVKQVLTYLRITDLCVGLILNFGAETMKQGLKRVVNNLGPATSPRPSRAGQPGRA